MVFDEIEAALSLLDRARKWVNKEKTEPRKTVVKRFVQLFEAHDVHRNQIPRFFGHNLEIAHVKDDNTLYTHLTEKILDDACRLFAVRREWLDCADDEIYEVHHFYKDIEGFISYLDDMKARQPDWLKANLIFSTFNKWEEDTLLIISEVIGHIGEKPINRYHFVSGWVHRYWKCRAELAACVAVLLNKHIYLKGQFVKESINRFCNGLEFSNALLGLRSVSPVNWHPDYWVYDPNEFCKDLADANFGKVNALTMWLEYYEKGFMTTGYVRADSVNEFANELTKLSSVA
jgi:hypothetical protein